MERGEVSTAADYDDEAIWAKLVPLDSRYPDIVLKSNVVKVCSEIKTSSTEKHEWCRIERNMDQVSALIHNTKFDSMLVDNSVVQVDDNVIIRCGDEIILGPESEGFMRYRFKVMPTDKISKKQLELILDPEHLKCSICLSIWHDVVTVAPCLHNFCNGCFSEWLKRGQKSHSRILCPQCRAEVLFVGRNHFLHNIEEDILQSDSSLRRSNEDMAYLDSRALIKSPLVIGNKRKARKRPRTTPPDEDNAGDSSCPQCVTEYAGFQCNNNTTHLQCQACGGMMPSRSNMSVPQHCLGCDRAFCGAYWHSLGVQESDTHNVCSPTTVKPISEYTLSRIPFFVHEKSRHEQDITEKCISHMGRSLQDVVSEWIVKLNNREIDRTTLPLNHSETITAQTHVCNECYDKVVSFLLYWFRVTLPRHHLPPEALSRQDCWYGSACRTQHHNEEHARRRNHVCRPTRGNNT